MQVVSPTLAEFHRVFSLYEAADAPSHPILELSHDSVSWTRHITHTQLCHSHKPGTNPGTRMRSNPLLPSTCTGSYNLHFWKQKGDTLKSMDHFIPWFCDPAHYWHFSPLSHVLFFHWVLITANCIFPYQFFTSSENSPCTQSTKLRDS